MRITERMIFNSGMRGLQFNAAAVLKAQERVSSGKKVLLPSDDPVSASRILNFNKTISQIDQHVRNSFRAEDTLLVTDSALESVQALIGQASARAVEMVNASRNADDRKIVAIEIGQIFEQIAALSNTTHEGQTIFSGDKVKTAPFDFEKAWHGKYVGRTPPEDIEIVAYDPNNLESGSHDRLNLTVDGINLQITLNEGTYDGASIAQEIQEKINIDDKMKNPDGTNHTEVTVSFVIEDEDTGSGHLEVQSNRSRGRSSVVFNKIVQPEQDPLKPAQVPLGDAREILGLLTGKSQLSGEEYLGNDAESGILIEPNVLVPKNLSGSRVFKGGKEGVDIFASLLNFQTALNTDNIVGIQTAIADMEKAINQTNDERATVGSRLSRLEQSRTQLETFQVAAKASKSQDEDIDLTEAISDLVLKQNALTASQSVFARIIQQQTLLDFLR
ncbi:MAG: flagellar hook-associated protein FlgL [Nitrospirota bacterium]